MMPARVMDFAIFGLCGGTGTNPIDRLVFPGLHLKAVQAPGTRHTAHTAPFC